MRKGERLEELQQKIERAQQEQEFLKQQIADQFAADFARTYIKGKTGSSPKRRKHSVTPADYREFARLMLERRLFDEQELGIYQKKGK